MRNLALGLLLAAPLAALAEEPKPPPAPPNMESYQLVLLWRGPRSTAEVTPEARRIQEEHIGHLKAMAASGKLVIAGPFSDQPDPALRGMCLYRAGSAAEARALAEKDPAVQAGRLRVEVLTWWVEKGYMAFPRAAAPAP
jgi:uncharacterized protein YciI